MSVSCSGRRNTGERSIRNSLWILVNDFGLCFDLCPGIFMDDVFRICYVPFPLFKHNFWSVYLMISLVKSMITVWL